MSISSSVLLMWLCVIKMEEGPLDRETLEIFYPLHSSLLVVSKHLLSALPMRIKNRRGAKHSRGNLVALHKSEFISSCALFCINFRNFKQKLLTIFSSAHYWSQTLLASCVWGRWRTLSVDYRAHCCWSAIVDVEKGQGLDLPSGYSICMHEATSTCPLGWAMRQLSQVR